MMTSTRRRTGSLTPPSRAPSSPPASTSNAGAGITIDHQLKQIKREIAADITAALTWKRAVYDMEMILGSYVVKLDSGMVEVSDEVTT